MFSPHAPNLFDAPAPVAPAPLIVRPSRQVGTHGNALRDYQLEDADAIDAAINAGKKRILCVQATGLGKGTQIAEGAARRRHNGRILALVDSTTLVHQLADDIFKHTGKLVGRIADGESQGMMRWAVVSTVQAMYTPDRHGRPLVEYDIWNDVGTVLLDECESFLAPRYRSVPDHLLSKEDTVAIGFTATPLRGDKTPMADFFDHQAEEEGPLLRTVEWGTANGWLVGMEQAFVRANIDTTTLKIVQRKDGTEDISSAQLVKQLSEMAKSEKDYIEFARGIVEVAGTRQGLVYAPPTVKAAQAVCHYLNAIKPGICDVTWGQRADGDRVVARAQAGEVQLLASVNQFTKGLNHPAASFAAILRLTTVYRLYAQMCGRVLRPHGSIMRALTEADSVAERLRIIAESPKPRALIADLVGTGEDLRTMQLVDMVAQDKPKEVRDRAKQIMLRRHRDGDEPMKPQKAVEEAVRQIAAEQRAKLAEQQRLREMIHVDGEVHVYGSAGEAGPNMPAAKPKNPASDKMIKLLVALAHQYSPEAALNIGKTKSMEAVGGMIRDAKKKGRKADWSRLRGLDFSAPAAPAAPQQKADTDRRIRNPLFGQTVTPDAVGVSAWQREQLGRIRYQGPAPTSYADASRILKQHTRGSGSVSATQRPQPARESSHLVGATEGVL